MIIHYSTTVQTVLGLMDEKGNVTQKFPIQADVPVLDAKEFATYVEKVLEQKKALEDQLPKPEVEEKK